MKKIAILHTTPATVDSLKALAAELMPGVQVVNFVDDSILPQLAENGGDVPAVTHRLVTYARFAEEAGAQAILNACSSVGEAVVHEQAAVSIPVVRIDEAMAEAAVSRGTRIGVAATVATTLNPTLRLLQQKAGEAGKQVELKSELVSEAYRRLMAGDKEGHDSVLTEALTRLAPQVDVVVLAQVSMARVVPGLPAGLQKKFLTSPRMGMAQVKAALESAHA